MNSLEDQSVSELMLSVSDRESNLEGAQAAFAELISRYRGYFYRICANFLSGRVSSDRARQASISAEDLLSCALGRIWDKADKFDERGSLDPDQQERSFLAWCGKVTNHVCIDELSKFNQEEVRDELFWESWDPKEPSTSCNPQLCEALQEAFELLPEKTKDVLLATAYHTSPSADHRRMPPDENKALAERLGMTPDAMRKTRQRGYQSIRDFIEAKGIKIERNPSK